jgi:hypothetical protein
MFHAISAAWARLARRITARLARDRELAVWYGWQAHRLGYGWWEFSDPRFAQLTAAHAAPAPASRSWAQAVLARRIRATARPQDRSAGRGA